MAPTWAAGRLPATLVPPPFCSCATGANELYRVALFPVSFRKKLYNYPYASLEQLVKLSEASRIVSLRNVQSHNAGRPSTQTELSL
jgi:hypothetical protein